MSKVQTINLKNDADADSKLIQSLRDTGFAIVTDHGIPKHVFEDCYVAWESFFGHPKYKKRFTFNKETQYGYFPMKSEKAKGATVADIKEFFHFFGNNPTNQLPNLPIEIKKATTEAFIELEALSVKLLNAIERGTPPEVNKCDRQWSEAVNGSWNTLFRILHYPPLGPDVEEGAVRAAAHEDINFITLLPSATSPGLQVLDNDGQWHTVDIDDSNSIIVNVGDMLQEATGGYYKSTTHRVCNPTGLLARHSRYSMPLFLHPNPKTRLSERHTAGSYLTERLKELGLI
jgi:isopenicillin N synthase-like dioxygenase